MTEINSKINEVALITKSLSKDQKKELTAENRKIAKLALKFLKNGGEIPEGLTLGKLKALMTSLESIQSGASDRNRTHTNAASISRAFKNFFGSRISSKKLHRSFEAYTPQNQIEQIKAKTEKPEQKLLRTDLPEENLPDNSGDFEPPEGKLLRENEIERLMHKKGNKVSQNTRVCLGRLTSDVEVLFPDRELAYAIDNGDCFFDAFAKGLNPLLNKPVTAKQLRKIVANYAQNLPEENWVRKGKQDKYHPDVAYNEWKENIGKAFSDNTTTSRGLQWGTPTFDGKILCMYFNVKLRVIAEEVGDDEETLRIYGDDYFTPDPLPEGYNPSHTVIMANIPGHFLPIVPKVMS